MVSTKLNWPHTRADTQSHSRNDLRYQNQFLYGKQTKTATECEHENNTRRQPFTMNQKKNKFILFRKNFIKEIYKIQY